MSTTEVTGEDAAPTAGPWEVYSMSEDEGWPEHMGWEGSIRSTTDKDADWVAVTIYRKADALLMAAAPDLLRLLTALIEADNDMAVCPAIYSADPMRRWNEALRETQHYLTQFGSYGRAPS